MKTYLLSKKIYFFFRLCVKAIFLCLYYLLHSDFSILLGANFRLEEGYNQTFMLDEGFYFYPF